MNAECRLCEEGASCICRRVVADYVDLVGDVFKGDLTSMEDIGRSIGLSIPDISEDPRFAQDGRDLVARLVALGEALTRISSSPRGRSDGNDLHVALNDAGPEALGIAADWFIHAAAYRGPMEKSRRSGAELLARAVAKALALSALRVPAAIVDAGLRIITR